MSKDLSFLGSPKEVRELILGKQPKRDLGSSERMDYVRRIRKSGTTVIALKYDDGILCGADRKMTAGYGHICSQNTRKIHVIGPYMLGLYAGSVRWIQFSHNIARRVNEQYVVSSGGFPLSVKAQAYHFANHIVGPMFEYSWDFIVAGILAGITEDKVLQIFDIGVDGSLSESKAFATDGSGGDGAEQYLDSVLGQKSDLPFTEALDALIGALYHAPNRDSYSSSPVMATPTIACITPQKMEPVFYDEKLVAQACGYWLKKNQPQEYSHLKELYTGGEMSEENYFALAIKIAIGSDLEDLRVFFASDEKSTSGEPDKEGEDG